ncbi:hypothetical protein AWM75_02545 [Aerococcus urinaehominis]|uniref:Uncharacterized protein n=1 Tax=Aerococcus urinaehominis TaxID=128944 RepID=A0A0X8FKF1_9LACT|nr:hypothetical protein [Aerococcus urinaehominis]AMB98942.1 hypothetical protein AWM75_02545 [Aerococcus urinaehominis]SDM40602.1 hypothetical protein SAMN04487985_11536 [Aerococcus urinaehominis]
MVRRTGKIFIEYNDYHDRPFYLKWGTAFAMDELVQGININAREAAKDPQVMPAMTRQEIDQILQKASRGHQTLVMQLYGRDQYGRYLDLIKGPFSGEADQSGIFFMAAYIPYDQIRWLGLTDQGKWSELNH